MTVPTTHKTFPIHPCDRWRLSGIPWELIAPHEAQAISNHDQTLTRLAERGGLSLCELLAVLTDRPYQDLTINEVQHAEYFVQMLMEGKPR